MNLCTLFTFSLLTTCAISASAEDAKTLWNSKFKESYESRAEGIQVSFTVQSPPKIEGVKQYPLLLALSGGLRVSPSEQFPFFQANATRTRIWGYRAISTYDVMQILDTMLTKYPIDPDRVYLMGFSAGGSGAMHVASCYPDRFAAVLPMVAAGNNYPIANFKNLPVAFHHGDRDWTSAICNARVQTQRMQSAGCPTLLKEYPGAGHSVPGSHTPLMKWLFAQKRTPVPNSITHDCEVPSLGSCYWLNIDELEDPHQRCFVEARISDGRVEIHSKNVAAFSLNVEQLPGVSSIQINEELLNAGKTFRRRNGRWSVESQSPKQSIRQYEAGAAANLYQGEPLLVVYGTQSERKDQLRSIAQKLARYGGPVFSMMPGSFAVVADIDLTPEQESTSNLLLVGRPEENSVSQALLPQLPIQIHNDVLHVEGRSKLPLHGQVLGMLHPHPKYPQRLIYMLAPFMDDLGSFATSPARYLAGSDGFDRVSQADLLVQNERRQIARQMQFDKSWNWVHYPNANKLIPNRFADRSNLAITYMKLMRAKSRADYALWWGPADKGMWGTDFNDLESYAPQYYTMADFSTQQRHYTTTTGSVSGADLQSIWQRWGKNNELICFPHLSPEDLDERKQYRINIPMDLYIKLGQRKKNLLTPVAGAAIPAKEVLAEIFK